MGSFQVVKSTAAALDLPKDYAEDYALAVICQKALLKLPSLTMAIQTSAIWRFGDRAKALVLVV